MATLPADPMATVLVRLNRKINDLDSAIDEVGIWICRADRQKPQPASTSTSQC